MLYCMHVFFSYHKKNVYYLNQSNAKDVIQSLASESRLNLDENLHKAFVRALRCVGRRPGESVC